MKTIIVSFFACMSFALCVAYPTITSSSTLLSIDGLAGIEVSPVGAYSALSTSSTTHQVWGFDAEGKAVVIAGTGQKGMHDGPAAEATFANPTGIAISPKGEVIIADTGNGAIRLLFQGRVTTLATGFKAPTDVSIISQVDSYDEYYYYDTSSNDLPVGIYVRDGDEVHLLNIGAANDECNVAVDLGTVSLGNPIVAPGSNYHANADPDLVCYDDDDYAYSPQSGVWFSFVGDGNTVDVSFSTKNDLRLFVFREPEVGLDTCDLLVCMGSREGTVSFCSQKGMKYYAVMSGHRSYDQGSFTLIVVSKQDNLCDGCECLPSYQCGQNSCGGSCNLPPCPAGEYCVNNQCEADAPNSQCSSAIPVELPYYTEDDTARALSPIYSGSICGHVLNSYTGLWYTFKGTGGYVTATTCVAATQADTILAVISDCDQYGCVGHSDDDCGDDDDEFNSYASSLTFHTMQDEPYYIMISSYGSSGLFGLNITSVNQKVDSIPPVLDLDVVAAKQLAKEQMLRTKKEKDTHN